jgi:hypothetical protein
LCVFFFFSNICKNTTTTTNIQVIVCVSARRAVSLLKEEIASCKVRIGKFFPKNGTIQEQQQQIQNTILPIIIGTPHRLYQLSSSLTVSDNHDTANKKNNHMNMNGKLLRWDHTQLVIIDNYQVPHKQYTVCTLPDTAKDCMKLIHEYIYPQLSTQGTKQQLQRPEQEKESKQKHRSIKKKTNCHINFMV